MTINDAMEKLFGWFADHDTFQIEMSFDFVKVLKNIRESFLAGE